MQFKFFVSKIACIKYIVAIYKYVLKQICLLDCIVIVPVYPVPVRVN